MKDIEDKIKAIRALDETVHDSFNSNVSWPRTTPPSPTPEEAVNEARVEAIKKGKPFKEARGTNVNKAEEDAINRYVDDLLEKLF